MNVEKRALEFVKEFEKRHKRIAEDIPIGRGYDLKSGNRRIEVKGTGKKMPLLVPFSQYNLDAIGKTPNYFFYFVFDIRGKPKLLILNKNKMLKKKKKSRERVIDYWLPFEKKDYHRSIILDKS